MGDSIKQNKMSEMKQNSQEEITPRKKIGKYNLIEVLSEGSFCSMYKAEFKDKLYAIKLLKPYVDNEDKALFLKEAQKLQSLRHQALPKFMELEKSNPEDGFEGSPYLVMEYIEGLTLDKIEKADLDTALGWLYDLARVLSYLHKNKILHNDIKPSNIQVSWSSSRGRSLKLLDIGISSFYNNANTKLYGTLAYMAPERFKGESMTTASDVYSFGLVAYELLNYTSAYDKKANTLEAWEKIHCNTEAKPITRIDIQSKIAQLIMRCLDKTPEKRPELDEIIETIGTQVIGIGQPSYIGIVGSRSSGKTCYLVSLYNEAFSTGTTQEVLEPLYINLYQKGILPKATAKTVSHLEFKIDNHTLITKDYGGELLKGRRKKEELNPLIKEFTEQQMDEIYEFFENARGILILLETFLEDENLQRLTDCSNEIKYLIEQISIRQDNQQKFPIPVALVVSKWDRQVFKQNRQNEIPLDPEKERKYAIEYLQNSHWRQIYQRFTEICNHVEVFPIYSFLGDNPKTTDIQTFNLCKPLSWLAERAESCLLERANTFHQENKENFSLVLDNFHRLLTAENILNLEIRKKIQNTIQTVSQEYLQYIVEEEKVYRLRPDIIIDKYEELLQTRGIYSQVKEQATKNIKRVQQQGKKQLTIYLTIACIVILFGSHFLYENWQSRSLQTEIGEITIDTTSTHILNHVQEYRGNATYNPLRRFWFACNIKNQIVQKCHSILARELQILKNTNPPQVPDTTKKYTKHEEAFLNDDIQDAQRKLTSLVQREKQCEQWKTFHHTWYHILDDEENNVEECQKLLLQTRSLKSQWQQQLQTLQTLANCFSEWDKEQATISQLQEEIILTYPMDGQEMIQTLEKYIQQNQTKLQTISHLPQFFQNHQKHECPYKKDIEKLNEQYNKYKAKISLQEDVLRSVQNNYTFYTRVLENTKTILQTQLTSLPQYEQLKSNQIPKLQQEIQTQQQKLQESLEETQKHNYSTLSNAIERHIKLLQTNLEQLELHSIGIEKQLEYLVQELRLQADQTLQQLTFQLQQINDEVPTENTGKTLQEWKKQIQNLEITYPIENKQDIQRKQQAENLIVSIQNKYIAYEKYWNIAQPPLERTEKYYIHENQTQERINYNVDKLQAYDVQAKKKIEDWQEFQTQYPHDFTRIVKDNQQELEKNRTIVANQLLFAENQLQQFLVSETKQKINQIEEEANYKLQTETDLEKIKIISQQITQKLQNISLPKNFTPEEQDMLEARQEQIMQLLQNYYIKGIQNKLQELQIRANINIQEDSTLTTLQTIQESLLTIQNETNKIPVEEEIVLEHYQNFQTKKENIFQTIQKKQQQIQLYTQIQNIKKYMQQQLANTNVEESPENLTNANQTLEIARNTIATWKIDETFTKEAKQKIRSAQYDFQKILQDRITENKTKIAQLELLETQLNNFTLENLSTKIQAQKSYSNILYEIQQQQNNLQNYPAFQRKYSQILETLHTQITTMREQDILDYETIRKELKNAEILKAYQHIQEYNTTTNHQHICDITIFKNRTTYPVQTTISIIPEANFDDGGDIPTFYFDIQMQKQTDKTVVQIHNLTTKNIVSPQEKETIIHEYLYHFSLIHNNILLLTIHESDWFRNEHYGTHPINMNELLNNKKITRTIDCIDSGVMDGKLECNITPHVVPIEIEAWVEGNF